MVIGITLFVVAVSIIAIWVIIEIKRMKHKLLAIFLIGLILFVYLSFAFVTRGQNIDLKTASGVIEAAKLYFSWLSSAFENLKTITTNAIGLEWGVNKTGR